MSRATKARTERSRYLFKVSEVHSGEPGTESVPYISLENRDGVVAPLQDAALGFDLREGTSFEQANNIAGFLKRNIESLFITTFEDHRYYDPSGRTQVSIKTIH